MKRLLSLIAVAIVFSPVHAGDLPPVFSLPPNEKVPGVNAVGILGNKDLGYGTKLAKFPEAIKKNSKASGKGVKVAVLDTGADVNHVWIKANVKGTYNAINKTRDVSDGNGHGTHCCGTITECTPDVELYVVKVLSDGGSGSVVDIAHGIDYATTQFKVDVISMSLGGGSPDSYMPPAINRAVAAGVLVIVAAGNDGPGANTDGYPARYPGVFSIAACNSASKIADFSSRGVSVFSTFPGVDIWSAAPGNKKVPMSGTSMACPHAASAAVSWCACATTEKKARPAAFGTALRNASSRPQSRRTDDGYGIGDVSKMVSEESGAEPPNEYGYDACMIAVKKGKVVTLNNGTFYECDYTADRSEDRWKSIPFGVYVCYLNGDRPEMIRVLPTSIMAPAKAQPTIPQVVQPSYQPVFPRLAPGCGPGGCPQPAWNVPGFRFR
jgi:hypothetical protein